MKRVVVFFCPLDNALNIRNDLTLFIFFPGSSLCSLYRHLEQDRTSNSSSVNLMLCNESNSRLFEKLLALGAGKLVGKHETCPTSPPRTRFDFRQKRRIKRQSGTSIVLRRPKHLGRLVLIFRSFSQQHQSSTLFTKTHPFSKNYDDLPNTFFGFILFMTCLRLFYLTPRSSKNNKN